jgi:hypothetical protein
VFSVCLWLQVIGYCSGQSALSTLNYAVQRFVSKMLDSASSQG